MSAREVRKVSEEELKRVLQYIHYIKTIDSGRHASLKWDDFEDVGELRDRNPDVDDYITLTLRLYSHEKQMKSLEKERLRLSRRVLSLQKGFIDGFAGDGGIFDGEK